MCSNCSHREEKDFWKERFKGIPKVLNLVKASALVGTTRNGSTLRRAIQSGRLAGKYDADIRGYVVEKKELMRYFVEDLHRHKRKGVGKMRANGSIETTIDNVVPHIAPVGVAETPLLSSPSNGHS